MSKITTTKIKNPSDSSPTVQAHKTTFDKVADWISSYAKYLGMGFAGIIVGCAVYFGFSFYSEKVALKVFNKSYDIEKMITDFEKKQDELKTAEAAKKDSKADAKAAAKTTTDPKAEQKTEKPVSVTTEDLDKLETEIQSKALDFIKAHPSHGASRNLALRWSKILFSNTKFDKSYDILNALKLEPKSSLEGLTYLAKASQSLQIGKINEAIEIFKSIISNKDWGYIHPEARYQLSLAYIENKNIDLALENLKSLKIEHPTQTKTIQDATKLMRWIQYSKDNEKN